MLKVTRKMLEKASEIYQNQEKYKGDGSKTSYQILTSLTPEEDRNKIKELEKKRDDALAALAGGRFYKERSARVLEEFDTAATEIVGKYLVAVATMKTAKNNEQKHVTEGKAIVEKFFAGAKLGEEKSVGDLLAALSSGNYDKDYYESRKEFGEENYIGKPHGEVDTSPYIDNETDEIAPYLREKEQIASYGIVPNGPGQADYEVTDEQIEGMKKVNAVMKQKGVDEETPEGRLQKINYALENQYEAVLQKRDEAERELTTYQKARILNSEYQKIVNLPGFNSAQIFAEHRDIETPYQNKIEELRLSVHEKNYAAYNEMIEAQKSLLEKNKASLDAAVQERIDKIQAFEKKGAEAKRLVTVANQKYQNDNANQSYLSAKVEAYNDLIFGYFGNLQREKIRLEGAIAGEPQEKINQAVAKKEKEIETARQNYLPNKEAALAKYKREARAEAAPFKEPFDCKARLLAGIKTEEQVNFFSGKLYSDDIEGKAATQRERKAAEREEAERQRQADEEARRREEEARRREDAKPENVKARMKAEYLSCYKNFKDGFGRQNGTKNVFKYAARLVAEKEAAQNAIPDDREHREEARARIRAAVREKEAAMKGAYIAMKEAHGQHGLAYKIFGFIPYLIEASKIGKLADKLDPGNGEDKLAPIFDELKEEGKLGERIDERIEEPAQAAPAIEEQEAFAVKLGEKTQSPELAKGEKSPQASEKAPVVIPEAPNKQ